MRRILRAAGKPLTLDQMLPRMERQLEQLVSKHRLYVLLSVMINNKELRSSGRGSARVYEPLRRDVDP